jgi:hypothetical protein
MAIQTNNTLLSTLVSGTPGSHLTNNSSGSISWSNKQDDKMIEFIEFTLEIMGVNLKYSEFKEMPMSERAAFIRDLKIDRILKGKEM